MQSKALQEVNNESRCLMCGGCVNSLCVIHVWLYPVPCNTDYIYLFRSTLEGCLWFVFSNNFRWSINITSGKQLDATMKDYG